MSSYHAPGCLKIYRGRYVLKRACMYLKIFLGAYVLLLLPLSFPAYRTVGARATPRTRLSCVDSYTEGRPSHASTTTPDALTVRAELPADASDRDSWLKICECKSGTCDSREFECKRGTSDVIPPSLRSAGACPTTSLHVIEYIPRRVRPPTTTLPH